MAAEHDEAALAPCKRQPMSMPRAALTAARQQTLCIVGKMCGSTAAPANWSGARLSPRPGPAAAARKQGMRRGRDERCAPAPSCIKLHVEALRTRPACMGLLRRKGTATHVDAAKTAFRRRQASGNAKRMSPRSATACGSSIRPPLLVLVRLYERANQVLVHHLKHSGRMLRPVEPLRAVRPARRDSARNDAWSGVMMRWWGLAPALSSSPAEFEYRPWDTTGKAREWNAGAGMRSTVPVTR